MRVVGERGPFEYSEPLPRQDREPHYLRVRGRNQDPTRSRKPFTRETSLTFPITPKASEGRSTIHRRTCRTATSSNPSTNVYSCRRNRVRSPSLRRCSADGTVGRLLSQRNKRIESVCTTRHGPAPNPQPESLSLLLRRVEERSPWVVCHFRGRFRGPLSSVSRGRRD